LVTTARVEAAWSIARQSQTVTASSVQAIADSLSAKADASTLYATVTQTIGRNVNPIDGTPAATGTFVQATPVSAACTLQTLLIYARATGTLTISKYSKSGITLTRTGVTTVTIASTGLKTLTSADFGAFALAAGEYLSISGAGIWAYTASTTADGAGWWQIANGATSATVGAAVTSARLELSAQFTRSEQVVTGPSFKTAQDIITRTAANQTSAAYPILLIADGNSLTAGQYSSPTYLWSSGAAASLGANSYNFGVPGQTNHGRRGDHD
jgi:hypothetical protein